MNNCKFEINLKRRYREILLFYFSLCKNSIGPLKNQSNTALRKVSIFQIYSVTKVEIFYLTFYI